MNVVGRGFPALVDCYWFLSRIGRSSGRSRTNIIEGRITVVVIVVVSIAINIAF